MKITMETDYRIASVEAETVDIVEIAEAIRHVLMAQGFSEQLVRDELDPRWGLEPLTDD